MGKHHYYFYVVGCNWCFKYTYAYCVCRAFHRFVARIRSVNGEEEVRPSTLQNILLYKWFQLSPLGALASRRICNRLATKVWTTKNLPMMQLVKSTTFSWLGFFVMLIYLLKNEPKYRATSLSASNVSSSSTAQIVCRFRANTRISELYASYVYTYNQNR